MRFPKLATAALVLALVGVLMPPAVAHDAGSDAPEFMAGAAQVDITPPPRSVANDQAAFVPWCGASAAQVSELWPGSRPFAFEKPYVDLYGLGRYAPGDPYCDSDHSGRYEAPYLGGGSVSNRWPESADASAPVGAQAIVMRRGGNRIALVVVDSRSVPGSTRLI